MNIEQERAAFEAWFTKTKAYISDPKDIFAQIARDIAWAAWQARAALQSPDIQERIRDGERLEWLAENINEIEVYRSQRGWCVVEKGTTRSTVEDCKTLRGALDAVMEKQP